MKDFDINELLKTSFNNEGIEVDLFQMFKNKADEYGLTVTQARELLQIERKSLMPILTGKAKQPNLITVMKIAEFLEINLNTAVVSILQNQDSSNIAQIERAKKTSFLGRNFDIDRLYKCKFIESKTDADTIVKRILSFFGFESIQEYERYEHDVSETLFSQTKRKFTDKMRRFAIISAFRMFEIIDNSNEYNREEAKNLIPKIKPYSRDVENGFYSVCRALYDQGITVIFQQHLPTTQFRGATMHFNKKPCIVLTDLNNIYPTIWFALLHELYHVLFDFEEIKKIGYHFSGKENPELFLFDEESADEFAQEFFFGYDMYKYIKPHIHSPFIVEKYARENNIHPSIIYRQFQYFIEKEEGKNYWGAFNEFFPDPEPAINKMSPLTWDSNITKIVKVLKETFELQNT